MNTVNVNLKPCDCTRIGKYRGEYPHFATCSATPIPLPCPIPRTVEMTVRLGEWECGRDETAKALFGHMDSCPARPIRVTCSIGGDGTWAGSEVVEVLFPHEQVPDDHNRVAAACRARWEIVKALLLNTNHASIVPDLFTQRDAVFSALAKMAQAEEAHLIALCDYLGSGLPEDVQVEVGHKTPPRQSPIALAAYVSHLIAKVGAL